MLAGFGMESSLTQQHMEQAAMDAILIKAAAYAEKDLLQAALASGADVNAVDEDTENSVITSVIAGDESERWKDINVSDTSFLLPSRMEVLKILLRSSIISLYTLNAPVKGVTPLGLAAWLNIPEAIRILLEESRGLVAVDGTDDLGVTPLMYAARDGAIDAVLILLTNGARPDLRSTHHRTAVHYALCHPRALFLCESMLRQQRWHEYLNGNKRQLYTIPHPQAAFASSFSTSPDLSEAFLSSSTISLIDAILANDLPAIYRILFPISRHATMLVNRKDLLGWAPIHHCVSMPNPSLEVLDALFLAGTDTSLYTSSGHGTPLHCFARKARKFSNPASAAYLQGFLYHLVCELRAPLSATDEEGETCIHTAAEQGNSVKILLAFLAYDASGTVRNMRNSRGLTAFQVAKPEFRAAFSVQEKHKKSDSVASFQTIRPSTHPPVSLASYASSMTVHLCPHRDSLPRLQQLSKSTYSSLSRRILEKLATVEQNAASAASTLTAYHLWELLDETSQLAELWVQDTNTRIQEAAQDLRSVRGNFNKVDSLLEVTRSELEGVFGKDLYDQGGGTEYMLPTISPAVDRKWRSMLDLRPKPSSQSIEDSPSLTASNKRGIATTGLSPAAKSLLHKSSLISFRSVRSTQLVSPSRSDGSTKGLSKLKAWFQKKLSFKSSQSSNQENITLSEQSAPSATSASTLGQHPSNPVPVVTFSSAHQVIRTTCQDLSFIEGCMGEADEFLSLAATLLSQTERRLKMLITSRQAALRSMLEAKFPDQWDHPLRSSTICSTTSDPSDCSIISHSYSSSNSDRSLQSVSVTSSVASLSSTLIGSDEDGMRALRNLLTHNVKAQTDKAFYNIDKALTWLRIIQDMLYGLQRQAQLSVALPDLEVSSL